MSKIWFTSDQHFGHKNIIHLSHRPFKSIEQMDQWMIDEWNACVASEDTIYHLGDFAYKNRTPLEEYCKALNGHKHLILGNHDKYKVKEYLKFFDTVQDILYVTSENPHEKHDFVLFHYPILSWRRRGKGAIHLYGHVHEAILSILETQRAYNVGVDRNDFKPISLEKIIELMKQRAVIASDKQNKNNETTEKREVREESATEIQGSEM